MSRSVRDHVHGRLGLEFEELGPLSLKNIARPVEVFVLRRDAVASRVFGAASWSRQGPSPVTAGQTVGRYSAVSEYKQRSGARLLRRWMVDDITTALSRFHSLFVIARNSAFTYKGRTVDIREIGRQLGVRYVVEGSVREQTNAFASHASLSTPERHTSVGRAL